jgi:thioredoxin-related protein
MKNFLLFLTFITFSLNQNLFAQNGISFEKGTLDDAFSKAGLLNKPLYLVVSTSWCGPCILMEKNYFPNDSVSKFYNEHFVNYKIDAEIGFGLMIAKKYAVATYPTHLYFDGKTGKIIYRKPGLPNKINGYIDLAKNALNEIKISNK